MYCLSYVYCFLLHYLHPYPSEIRQARIPNNLKAYITKTDRKDCYADTIKTFVVTVLSIFHIIQAVARDCMYTYESISVCTSVSWHKYSLFRRLSCDSNNVQLSQYIFGKKIKVLNEKRMVTQQIIDGKSVA